MNKVEIIPAILERSLALVRERLEQVADVAPRVQLDVVDGVFVPTVSWPYTRNGREEFEKIIAGDEGLPFWEKVDFEIDLMSTHAVRDAREWVAAGASSVVVHIESPDSHEAMEMLQQNRTGEFAVSIGMALPCTALLADAIPFNGLFDYIQVMGIANVGKQGEQIDERAVSLIASLRAAYPTVTIQVDGGVRIENARTIADAGATRLVVGSAIFREGDPRANIERLCSVLP